MKSSKIWIRAVTLVTIVIIISLFLSLFKGIALYNLNFGPVSIGELFFRLHNRIVIKIDRLKVAPTKQGSSSGGPGDFKLSYLRPIGLIEELELRNFSAPGVEGNFSYRDREFQFRTNLGEGRGWVELKPNSIALQLEELRWRNPPVEVGSSYLEVSGESLGKGLQLGGFVTIGGGVLYFQGRVDLKELQLGVTGGIGELRLPEVALKQVEGLEGEFQIPLNSPAPTLSLHLKEGRVEVPAYRVKVALRELNLTFDRGVLEGEVGGVEVEAPKFKLRRGVVANARLRYRVGAQSGEVRVEKVGFDGGPFNKIGVRGYLSTLRLGFGVESGLVDGEFQRLGLNTRGPVRVRLTLSGGGFTGNYKTRQLTGAIYRALLRQQQNWVQVGAITFGYTPQQGYLYTHWIKLGNRDGNGSIINLALEQRGSHLGYSLRDGVFQLKPVPFQLKVPLLYGTEVGLQVPKLELEGWGLPGEGRELVVNLRRRWAKLSSLEFSGVELSPVEVNLTNRELLLSFESNTTLNRQVQLLLKRGFGVEVPVVEKRGENRIRGIVQIPLRQPTPNFQVKGEILNALFQLTTLPLSLEQALIQVTPTGVEFQTRNLQLQFPGGQLKFSGVGEVNFPGRFLGIEGNLSLAYPPFLSIPLLPERGRLELDTLTFQLERLGVKALLRESLVEIPLNPLLRWTPFTPLLAGGEVNLSYSPELRVKALLSLTQPLFPDQRNPRQLSAEVVIGDQLNLTLPFGRVEVAPPLHQLHFQLANREVNLTPVPELVQQLNRQLKRFQPETPSEKSAHRSEEHNTTSQLQWKVAGGVSNLTLLYDQWRVPIGEFQLSVDGPKGVVQGSFRQLKVEGPSLHLPVEEGNFSYSLQRGEIEVGELSSPPVKVKVWEHNGYLIGSWGKVDLNWFEKVTKLKGLFAQLNLEGSGVVTPDNFAVINIHIWDTIVAKLKLLNNIIALINTIPAILSFQPAGFSGKGYKIKEGRFTVVADKSFKTVHLTRGAIIGKNQNLNLFFWGYLYPPSKSLDLMVRVVIPIKVKHIPLIGPLLSYILFGKSGGLVIDVKATGNWEDPKVELSTVRDLTAAPLKILYRILSSPFQLEEIYNGVYNGGDLEGEE